MINCLTLFQSTQVLNKETTSPTFFSFYLHDMPDLFKENQSDPPALLDSTPIGSLLWADDLVILSNTEQGLNFSLAKLENILRKTFES